MINRYYVNRDNVTYELVLDVPFNPVFDWTAVGFLDGPLSNPSPILKVASRTELITVSLKDSQELLGYYKKNITGWCWHAQDDLPQPDVKGAYNSAYGL